MRTLEALKGCASVVDLVFLAEYLETPSNMRATVSIMGERLQRSPTRGLSRAIALLDCENFGSFEGMCLDYIRSHRP